MHILHMTLSNETKTEQLIFDKPELIIGKKIESDIYIDNHQASRRHARLYYENRQWHIEDLHSTNGTLLNHKAVKKSPLTADDIVEIADYKLQFKPHRSEIPAKERVSDSLKQSIENSSVLFVPPTTLHKRLSEKLDQLLEKNRVAFASQDEKKSYISQQLKEMLGLGFLENYLSDPTITEVMINGPDEIYIEQSGAIRKTPERFSSPGVLMNIIDRVLTPLGRHVDETSPLVDARLPDGSRIHIALPPISLQGAVLTIRKFLPCFSKLDDLVSVGSIDQHTADLLKNLVRQRKNILISGGTSSGKTTLLNVLANCISDSERLITIEDSAELKLTQPHTIRLESRPANIENKGEIPIRVLVQNALRMRPDRIIVGECRGAEAFDMLQAMNTGHDGCLSTCHSNSPRDALKRIENMVMMAGLGLPSQAIREQIASAIQIIVQTRRQWTDAKALRTVTHITKISGMERETLLTHDIFNSTKGDPHDIDPA